MMDLSRFCITGMPRSRTAWIAALMTAHGVETLHEYPPFFPTLGKLGDWLLEGTPADPRGYVDGFAIIHHAWQLRTWFAKNPIVIIQRDPMAVRRSWERFRGTISDHQFADVLETIIRFRVETFAAPNILDVPYAKLDDYDTVNAMAKFCTGRELKRRTFQLFDHLKIEIHQPKCYRSANHEHGSVDHTSAASVPSAAGPEYLDAGRHAKPNLPH